MARSSSFDEVPAQAYTGDDEKRLNNDTSFVRRLTNPFERNGMGATGVSDG